MTTDTPTALNIVQTVELLNFASNGVSGITGNPVELQAYLECYLTGGTDNPPQVAFDGFFAASNPIMAGGDWELAWGPSVYCEEAGTAVNATNAMFVAKSAANSMYVVAVAGTNFISFYDWISEDADVVAALMVNYPLGSASPVGKISAATATGLKNLLAMTGAPASAPNTQVSLESFLTSVASADQTLVFTGHSLGGALAPTLAYQLYPETGTSSSNWADVLFQASAGASPGDSAVATAIGAATAYSPKPTTAALKDTSFANWNVNYASTRDVVPHAWNRLPQMYTSGVIPLLTQSNQETQYGWVSNAPKQGQFAETKFATALLAAVGLASGGGYMNLTLQPITPAVGENVWTQSSNGAWVVSPTNPAWKPLPTYPQSSPVTDFSDLEVLILAAHTSQYSNFFGIVVPRLPTNPGTGAVAGAEPQPEAVLEQPGVF